MEELQNGRRRSGNAHEMMKIRVIGILWKFLEIHNKKKKIENPRIQRTWRWLKREREEKQTWPALPLLIMVGFGLFSVFYFFIFCVLEKQTHPHKHTSTKGIIITLTNNNKPINIFFQEINNKFLVSHNFFFL